MQGKTLRIVNSLFQSESGQGINLHNCDDGWIQSNAEVFLSLLFGFPSLKHLGAGFRMCKLERHLLSCFRNHGGHRVAGGAARSVVRHRQPVERVHEPHRVGRQTARRSAARQAAGTSRHCSLTAH